MKIIVLENYKSLSDMYQQTSLDNIRSYFYNQFTWITEPYTPETGETLQVTTTYFRPWFYSYERHPFFILFRFIVVIVLCVFLILDVKRDRTHSYLYSKADQVPYLIEPFNWIYILTCVTYCLQLRLYFTHLKKDLFYMDGKYNDKKHYEAFPADFGKINYFTTIMLSILPPMVLAHGILFFETNNFHTNIREWQQVALISVTMTFVLVDSVLLSNYFMDFSHLVIGLNFLGMLFCFTSFYRIVGLVVYPMFDPVANAYGSFTTGVFFSALFGFFFLVCYLVSLLKQEYHHTFQTALWFRKDPNRIDIKDFEVLANNV